MATRDKARTMPIDGIPPEAKRHAVTPAQSLLACGIGALLLLLLASRDLPGWAERHQLDPAIDAATPALVALDDGLSRVGLTAMHDALRAAADWAAELRWGQTDEK